MEQNIEDLLSAEEVEFVKRVFLNPGGKCYDCFAYLKGSTEEEIKAIPLWENPEKLGIIRCVGGYKWEPAGLTMKLFMKAAVEIPDDQFNDGDGWG